MRGLEARVRELERVEAADEERRADEQGQGQRGLDPDERRARQAASRGRHSGTDPDTQIAHPRHRERRRQGAGGRAREREESGGDERRETDADLRSSRHASRTGRADQKVARPQRQRETGAGGNHTDDEILRDNLANDSRLAGAERESRGELVLPLQRSADEQPRGVAARDTQQRDDRGGKRIERRADVACQLFEQPGNCRASAPVRVRMLDCERLGEDSELGVRLRDCYLGTQAAEHP